MTTATISIDEAIAVVEATPDYKVIRRFFARDSYAQREPLKPGQVMPPALHHGLVVDVETDGLEPDSKVIEFAAVPFDFSHSGVVYDVGQPFQGYQDPGSPLPREIVELTGITDEMVRGKQLDRGAIATMINDADLIVAHNAAFDRPRVEDLVKIAAEKHWACSQTEVDWSRAGAASGRKLEWLLFKLCSEYYDAHSGREDALVALHILAAVQIDRRPALASLLTSARQKSIRLWAEGAPFQVKDRLKARGYRWSAAQKTWAIDLKPMDVDEEKVWLAGICGVKEPREQSFDSLDRYSRRVEL